MRCAHLVDISDVSILNDRGDETAVRHCHSQRDVDVLIVCGAVAVSCAGCTAYEYLNAKHKCQSKVSADYFAYL